MTLPAANGPTIFETTPIAPDDPLLKRPISKLPLEFIVHAARIVTDYPDVPEIQQYRRHVVTLRITAEEFSELVELNAAMCAAKIARAPERIYDS